MNSAGRRFARRTANRLARAATEARLISLWLDAGETPQEAARHIGTDVHHAVKECHRAGRPDVARRLGGAS